MDEHRELLLRGRIEPLSRGGVVYELDTTDFAAIDYAQLYETLTGTQG